MENIFKVYVYQTPLKHKSYSLYYSELAKKTLVRVESRNSIKIKITHLRVIRAWMLAESVSLLSSLKFNQWWHA